jgi:threonine aldolase
MYPFRSSAIHAILGVRQTLYAMPMGNVYMNGMMTRAHLQRDPIKRDPTHYQQPHSNTMSPNPLLLGTLQPVEEVDSVRARDRNQFLPLHKQEVSCLLSGEL